MDPGGHELTVLRAPLSGKTFDGKRVFFHAVGYRPAQSPSNSFWQHSGHAAARAADPSRPLPAVPLAARFHSPEREAPRRGRHLHRGVELRDAALALLPALALPVAQREAGAAPVRQAQRGRAACRGRSSLLRIPVIWFRSTRRSTAELPNVRLHSRQREAAVREAGAGLSAPRARPPSPPRPLASPPPRAKE